MIIEFNQVQRLRRRSFLLTIWLVSQVMPENPSPSAALSTTWNVDETQVDRAVEKLDGLAHALHHTGTEPLPVLDHGESLTKSFAERVSEFMQRWFRFQRTPKFDLATVIEILKWGLAALFVAVVLSIAYRLFLHFRGPAAIPAGTPAGPELAEDRLSRELKEALVAGNFSRAARLRWRLFLKNGKQIPSATPFEFFRNERMNLELWLNLQYRAMFSTAPSTRPEFDQLDQKLTSFERPSSVKNEEPA